MKKAHKYILNALLPAVLLMGCTDDFVDINTDSSTYNISNFDPNSLLTTVELSYAGSTYDNYKSNIGYCSYMVQLLSTTFGGLYTGDKYPLFEDYLHTYWTFAFPDQVKPVEELLALTKDKAQHKNLHQMARILRAAIYQRLTDMYGDIPYSQAGKAYHEGFLYPVYDRQEAIYSDILKELEEATNQLDAASPLSKGDPMFAGNIDKWKKFGNTLLLRAAMRLTKVNESLAKETVKKVLGKTMASNNDNAFLLGSGGYGEIAINNRNSYIFRGTLGGMFYYIKWSKTFVDFLKENNDPRLGKVTAINVWTNTPTDRSFSGVHSLDPAVQKGLPNGKDTSVDPITSIYNDPSYTGAPNTPSGLNTYSSPNPVMIKLEAPTFFITYAEAELLLAEAAARWGSEYGVAATHYNNGVKGAMTYLTQYDATLAITDAQVADYLAANPYNSASGLAMINTQLWAVLGTSFNFYEAWSNWRRTGIPALTPINYPGNATNGTIPRRFTYPVSEASTNTANLEAAKALLQGGDYLTSRVWWDK